MNDLTRSMKRLMGGAAMLQELTIDSEQKQREKGVEYSERHVKQATVHTRQDLILLVYHIHAINTQTKRIYAALLLLILIAGADFVLRLM